MSNIIYRKGIVIIKDSIDSYYYNIDDERHSDVFIDSLIIVFHTDLTL
jgi:hypothetical protein